MGVNALDFRKAQAANSTATAFTEKLPLTTAPSGTGVFDLLSEGVGLGSSTNVPTFIHLVPFGTDANDETFDMRLWGWSKVSGSAIWVPYLLSDLSCTLGNIAATEVGANHFMVDTIVVNQGPPAGFFRDLINTADNTPASIMLHLRGSQYIEFDFDRILAAAANCFWRTIDE